MSPTERELRAALRSGDGEALDPDRVISRARAARRQRRVRGVSVAAAVAVVAAVGVVGGLALRPDAKDKNAYSPASGYATHTPGVNPGGPIDRSVCPATYPTIAINVPRKSGQEPMPGEVGSVVVCAYGATAGSSPSGARNSVTVTGAEARALASSLNGASSSRSQQMCPTYQVADTTPIAMIATTTDGTRLGPVITQLGQNPCNLPVIGVNGAVRYNWVPPQDLIAKFATLRSGTAGGTSTTPGLPGGGSVSMPAGSATSTVTDPQITVNQPTPPRASGSPAR